MKGRTIIELTDVRTGEKEIHEDCNMFTNALDYLFNRAPFWFNNEVVTSLKTDNYTNYPMTPIVGNALGGLLLFPQVIEENAETIFAPATNKPTGISSFDGYSGADARRGSYNAIESGAVPNGWKFVFDFSTSQANGLISCVGLTSKRGGAGYWDAHSWLIGAAPNNNRQQAGAGHALSLNYVTPIGYDDNGVYFTSGLNANIVYKIATPRAKYSLLGDSKTPILLGTVDTNGSKTIHDGELWVVRNGGNASGNATLTIDKYDLNTWAKTTETMTVAAQLRASDGFRNCAISNGYMYLNGYDSTSMVRFSISNPADVMKIENVCPVLSGNNMRAIGCIPFNGGVIAERFLIEADGTAHTDFDLGVLPVACSGTWLLNFPSYWTADPATLGATTITPFLATINNLDRTINKTANQTMKVSYIVTE